MSEDGPEPATPPGKHGWQEGLSGKKVYIETYGCRFNFGDSADLVEILKCRGCVQVDDPDNADVLVINTCTVVGPTERRMLRRLSQFRERSLYVTGCMPMVQREAIYAVCNPVIIPPEEIRAAYLQVGTVAGGEAGVVQIAQGCLGRCTYCITRAARGPLKSFPVPEIVGKIRAFIDAGTPEIQLTAQDVSAWGRDVGKNLPELLAVTGSMPGQYMIRVGMMNPATVLSVLDPLVESFASDHIFRFIHLPVQSGSDRILREMGRGYSVDDFETIVAAFRKKFPEITVATDMIVGFPGEEEEDFSCSLSLIERIKPNKVNVTRYSTRPFTQRFAKKDLPDSVKKDRSRELNKRAEQVYSSINAGQIGKVVPFMVTEKLRRGSVLAWTPDYIGVVIREVLPLGFAGKAVLKEDRKYFFMGERIS